MERSTNDILLDYIDRAAFCVRGGVIVQANHAAQQKGIYPETPVSAFLGENESVYADFRGGSLYLTLLIYQLPCGASVTRTEDMDIFLLDEDIATSLQVLALSAQHLRTPLQNAFSIAELLQQDRRYSKTGWELSKGLHQLHRIICNMADTYRYNELTDVTLVSSDLTCLFSEMMEKCSAFVEKAGFSLEYHGLYETVIGMAAPELLERAIYNLISNAVKYSTAPAAIKAELTRCGRALRFTVTDQGCGIAPEALGTVFSRYLRGPRIEDGRNGIGLGLALVRAAAVTHGGTVLIDQPGGVGLRVTMTLAIRQEDPAILHSPVTIPTFDYTGGYDHGLVELSEILPADAYKTN